MVDYFGEVARMEFEGEITILAGSTRVWQLTSDPEVLMSCIPGAKEINQISASEYEGTIERGVGGVSITLVGGAEIVELDPPNRILARASGEDPKTKSRMTATAELELLDEAAT
jgi:carbon monoxide dehydrogenase subunit G